MLYRCKFSYFQITAAVYGNRHQARFERVAKLPMCSSRPNFAPAILLQRRQPPSDSHRRSMHDNNAELIYLNFCLLESRLQRFDVKHLNHNVSGVHDLMLMLMLVSTSNCLQKSRFPSTGRPARFALPGSTSCAPKGAVSSFAATTRTG